MEWIKCSDRLPYQDKKLFPEIQDLEIYVSDKVNLYIDGEIYAGYLSRYEGALKKQAIFFEWFIRLPNGNGQQVKLDHVTHWCEIEYPEDE